MKPVYGFSNTNHIDLFKCIKKYKPRSKIFLQGRDNVEDLSDSTLAVFNSVDFLSKHVDKVSDNCIIFITDLAVNLKRVSGIVMVDTRMQSSMKTDFFNLSDSEIQECLVSKATYPYKRLRIKDLDIYENLFKKQPVSVLSTIFTNLYSIQNKERREEIKNKVFHWLYSKDKTLEVLLKDTNLRKGNSLRDYLHSEDVEKLRTILAAETKDIKELLKKYNVAKFDVKYLLKFKNTKQTNKVNKQINLTKK